MARTERTPRNAHPGTQTERTTERASLIKDNNCNDWKKGDSTNNNDCRGYKRDAERTAERTLERATQNAERNWNAHPRATKPASGATATNRQ